MKKIALLGMLFFCFFSSIFAQIPGVTVTLSSQWRVIGLGAKTEFSILNPTTFFLEIIISGKTVAYMGPGSKIFSSEILTFANEKIPILARIYADPEYSQLIGIDGGVFSIDSGISFKWVAGENIRFLDGRSGYVKVAYPYQAIHSSGRFNVPQPRFASSVAVQFVNCTFYTAIIRIDGEKDVYLKSGDTWTLRYDGGRYSYYKSYSIEFGDYNGSGVGFFSGKFPISGFRNPHAWQLIITPALIK